MEAPFVFGKLAGPEDFTNRKKELAQLHRNFSAGVSTIIISPRRWGKSSLVQQATRLLQKKNKKIKTCTLDLFSTRTEEEFYEQLAKTVITATGNKLDDITEAAKKFLGKFIPQISISPDPNSDISIGLNWKEVKKDPSDILNLAEKIAANKKIHLVVCIDEFQNIASFSDPLAFQKKLRAAWQRHKHVSYCLYGSKRHMMLDVFSNPSMPFYKFGDLLFLEKIPLEDWQRFIVKRFADTGKSIAPELAEKIALLSDRHTYYTQQLAQQTWLRSSKKCSEKQVMESHNSICNQLGLLFQMMTDGLTTTQVNFLRALLNGVEKLSAKDTLETYRLGTSANVIRIREALVEKEILDDTEGTLQFLDPYYAYWLRTVYFQ
jgi:AAA+ ATPase superfamily predicted ATPase